MRIYLSCGLIIFLLALLLACGRDSSSPSGNDDSATSANTEIGESAANDVADNQDIDGGKNIEDIDIESADEPDPAIDWTAPTKAVPAEQFDLIFAASEQALTDGVLLAADLPAKPSQMDTKEVDAEESIAAIDGFLSILATDPKHEQALDGLSRALTALAVRGRIAANQGKRSDALKARKVIESIDKTHSSLVPLNEFLSKTRQANRSVRIGDSRAKKNRRITPEKDNALLHYRQALTLAPEYVPAKDAIGQLERDELAAIVEKAKKGEFKTIQTWLNRFKKVFPDSPNLANTESEIQTLRDQRMAGLIAEADKSIERLELESAGKLLDQAKQLSSKHSALSSAVQRLQLARRYGHFRPGQIFTEPLTDGGIGPTMIVIPHGSLTMGSASDEPGHQAFESPTIKVTFERGFALSESEITVLQFRRFVEATSYQTVAERRGRSMIYDERGGAMIERRNTDWRRDYSGKKVRDENLPVIHIAFDDAMAYASWLSKQTGQRYRLPSEAEFEYVLRGGNQGMYPWGDTQPTQKIGNLTGDGDKSNTGRRWGSPITNYADSFWGPAPVRSFSAEAFGTYDMIGNVSEWVLDCWHDSYKRAPKDGRAWVNPGCENRVVRGASWASALDQARSAYRLSVAIGTVNARVGFRIARDL